MTKKAFKLIDIILCIMIIVLTAAGPVLADDDDLFEGQYSNSFYMPKARFMSSYDYEEYCQRMYYYGYMDENYEWIPEAQTYINNMTDENFDVLDEKARALVDIRIENGEMDITDSPYITKDERDEILAQRESSQAEVSPTPEEQQVSVPEPSGNIGPMDPVEAEETPEPEPEQNSGGGSSVNRIIMIILIAAVLVGAYVIYRRQFK